MLPSLLISTLTDISYTGFKRGFCAFLFLLLGDNFKPAKAVFFLHKGV